MTDQVSGGTTGTTTSDNPLYDRITHSRGKEGERTASQIGLIVGVVAFGVAILSVVAADMTQLDVFAVLTKVLLVSSLFSSFAVPSFAMVFAAVMVARMLADENLSIILITPLRADQILLGLVDGVRYRLRFIRSIGLCIIPAGGVAVALVIGFVFAGASYCPQPCRTAYQSYVALGGVPALILTLYLMLTFATQFWIALYVGVWFCLRIGQRATILCAVLASVHILLVLPLFVIVLPMQIVLPVLPLLLVDLGLVGLLPLIGLIIGRLARNDSISLIQNRALFQKSL